MDPHSFFAESDPTAFLNADPDPATFLIRIQNQLKMFIKKYLMKSFLVEKIIK